MHVRQVRDMSYGSWANCERGRRNAVEASIAAVLLCELFGLQQRRSCLLLSPRPRAPAPLLPRPLCVLTLLLGLAGAWGNNTVGLSGVDAGAPADGDCDGGWQQLEQNAGSSWNGHGEGSAPGDKRTWGNDTTG